MFYEVRNLRIDSFNSLWSGVLYARPNEELEDSIKRHFPLCNIPDQINYIEVNHVNIRDISLEDVADFYKYYYSEDDEKVIDTSKLETKNTIEFNQFFTKIKCMILKDELILKALKKINNKYNLKYDDMELKEKFYKLSDTLFLDIEIDLIGRRKKPNELTVDLSDHKEAKKIVDSDKNENTILKKLGKFKK